MKKRINGIFQYILYFIRALKQFKALTDPSYESHPYIIEPRQKIIVHKNSYVLKRTLSWR